MKGEFKNEEIFEIIGRISQYDTLNDDVAVKVFEVQFIDGQYKLATTDEERDELIYTKREGGTRASNHAETKVEAVKLGKELAKNSGTEHVIHNKDGKIGEKNSYGNDPFPPKG